jgi:hypothetical protein
LGLRGAAEYTNSKKQGQFVSHGHRPP